MKTIIVIPARMASERFPNKPMALIDGMPMIKRVWKKAIEADIGKVIVACSEKEVFDLIKSSGGKAIMTKASLPSGTDRVFHAISSLPEIEYFDSIINLQGDMPLINSQDIKKVNIPIVQGFDIGTLVTKLDSNDEIDENITKARINWIKKNELGHAFDFYKISKKNLNNIYHHVGIYSFTFKALKRFVNLKPSYNELYHKLEQWRALDVSMSIGVSFINNNSLSVDTEEDLKKVENIIKANNE